MAPRSFALPEQLIDLLEEGRSLAEERGVTLQAARRWLTDIVATCVAAPGAGYARLGVVDRGNEAPQLFFALEPSGENLVELHCKVETANQGAQPEQVSLGAATLLLEVARAGRRQTEGLRAELDETHRGLATLYAEIEARTKAEHAAAEAAQQLERQWQVTFDSLSVAIVVCDDSLRAVRVNRAAEALLGTAAMDSPLPDVLAEKLHAPTLPDFRTSVRALPLDHALHGRRFALHVDPVVTQGRWRGSVVRLHDVTQARALQAELEEHARRLQEVDSRKDDYIAMLGHELRNPLATMEAAIDVLREGEGAPASGRGREALATLERHTRNVRRLLDDLLNVSRMKQGKIVLRKQPLDFCELVRERAADSAHAARARGHGFCVHTDDAPVYVDGDATRLEQVVGNLLDNAIKYTPGDGEIGVVAGRDGGDAVLTVRDTGEGFEPWMIESAFDAFVQFQHDSAESAGGMGLGLSVVRSIVELHGGHVYAHSEGRGRGAKFEVRLPAVPDRAERPSSNPVEGLRTEFESIPLLLVEDNEDLRELTAGRLARRGFEVHEAATAEQALERARETPPAVLVTDIGLPGTDGFQLAYQVAEVLGNPSCVRIALSGYGPPTEPERRVLFDAYLVKPLDVEKLLEVVRGHLG